MTTRRRTGARFAGRVTAIERPCSSKPCRRRRPNSEARTTARAATRVMLAKTVIGCRTECGFGATRVGVLLERLQLHLGTDRFLAIRRNDPGWARGCDDATRTLVRLESKLSPSRLGARLTSKRGV